MIQESILIDGGSPPVPKKKFNRAEWMRAYRARNRERFTQYEKRRHEKHGDARRAKNRAYFKDYYIKSRVANHTRYLWHAAKRRAKVAGLPFNIEIADIIIPEVCPVLGIPLCRSNATPKANSPSLDRIVGELGYVKGNIEVISMRANIIKSDATASEIAKVLEYVTKRKAHRGV